MTINETAQLLRISSRSVYRLIHEGLLPAERIKQMQVKEITSYSVDSSFIQQLVGVAPLGNTNAIRKYLQEDK